ncbi:bestrophin family protein [Xanthobacter variabilis]|uniref:bestrophin family protein n=1 Tax=Xanthobacter variabilis TaxID=3119932 RepID=UPI003729A686
MIVRERPGLIRLFLILRGSVLQRIFPQVMVVMVLSALVVLLHGRQPGLVPSFSGAPFALLGIALSVFLGFSNSACYDRWWEARKAWGALVATTRDLVRRGLILERRGADAHRARDRLVRLASAFGHTLVAHLRPGSATAEIARTAPPDLAATLAASGNGPELVLRAMGRELAELRQNGHVSDIEYRALDDAVTRMNDVLAACERIKGTPVPFGYLLLLHRTAYLFCFLLPFGFADVLGWATPVATGLVAYTFFGLDALGSELEEPFGTLPNDLPIAALATQIEIGLLEAIGERELPPAPEPADHILV